MQWQQSFEDVITGSSPETSPEMWRSVVRSLQVSHASCSSPESILKEVIRHIRLWVANPTTRGWDEFMSQPAIDQRFRPSRPPWSEPVAFTQCIMSHLQTRCYGSNLWQSSSVSRIVCCPIVRLSCCGQQSIAGQFMSVQIPACAGLRSVVIPLTERASISRQQH